MNSDDPKLTAYALDELDPTERAEIEQLLRENPDALAEVEETKTFVTQLRRELKAEAGAPLTEEQKATVLAAAETQAEPFSIDLVAPPQSGRWIHRWLPIAAGIVIVASVAALTINPLVQQKAARSGSDISPSLPSANDDKPSPMSSPELVRADAVSPTTEINGYVAATSASPPGLSSDKPAPEAAMTPRSPQIPQQFSSAVGTPDPAAGSPLLFANSNPVAPSTSPAAPVAENTAGPGNRMRFKSDVAKNKGSLTAPEEKPALALAPVPTATPIFVTRTESRDGMVSVDQNVTYSGGTLVKSGSGTLAVGGKAAESDRRRFVVPASAPAQAGTPARIAMKSKDNVEKQLDDISRLGGSSAATTRAPELHPEPTRGNTEAYDAITDNAFLAVRENPLSTFSIDVDTASYANVRRFLNAQTRPPKGAVRIEELLNYFTYDYPQPEGDAPFSSTMEVATCPWAPEHRLVRIGLKGRDIAKDKRPASNLVFLIDVSGSMQPENKLPLLKRCLAMLVDQLTPEDTVSIAVYAGASGTVLEPTHSRAEIRAALDRLESGGSTNGAAGIQLAYRLAEQSFIKGGVNRVILATDGDFNVGVTSQSELTDLITRKAKKGTFLTVLGFGMGNLKDSTLEKLADKGNGNYAYIDTLQEGRKVLVEQMNGTLITIAKDVKIQVEFNPAQVGAYRLIGYENRLLAKEDFNDDKKDAGEIGAGHTVTALYEVVPAGQAVPGVPSVDALKYQGAEVGSRKPEVGSEERGTAPLQSAIRNPQSAISPELLTLKLRYKQPDGDVSKLLEFPLTDRGETWEKSSRDFRFAASVAGFGMLLRESPHKGTATWDTVRELAMEGRGEDRSGYRGEFLTLLDKAKALER